MKTIDPETKRTVKKTYTLAMVSLALLMTTGIGFAAEAQEDKWQFGVTVPIWTPGIDGDVTVRGVKSDLDVGFDDLWDHLDASFALGLEARRNKFGLFAGVGYMKFSADGKGRRGSEVDAEMKFLVADAGMSYCLVKTTGEHPFILEATAGIRYWVIENELDLRLPTPGGGIAAVNVDSKTELLDPVFGFRASQYLNPKWHLDFQGDVGGFGISDDTSDLTWSAAGLVSYDAAKWITLSSGYKALSLDTSEGSGASKKGADLIFHGLLLTARLNF